MKKIILIFVIAIIITNLYSLDLSNYSLNIINKIPVGNEEGMLGWRPSVAGGASGPSSFAISQNNKIYIPDRVNYRINVYDLNLNFLKTISEEDEKNAHFSLDLKADNHGNLYYTFSDSGIVKINNQGEKIYIIEPQSLFNEVFYRNNFFIIDENFLFYNDKNEIQYIDSKGNIKSTEEASSLLQQLSIQNQQTQTQLTKSILSINSNQQLINNLNKEKDLLLINDNFYSTMFFQHKKYYDKIKPIRDSIISQNLLNKSRSITNTKNIDINLDEFMFDFKGYDNDHNSYWKGLESQDIHTQNYCIIIMSKYGEILDAFYYGQDIDSQYNLIEYPASPAIINISPNGDVYFLVKLINPPPLAVVMDTWLCL